MGFAVKAGALPALSGEELIRVGLINHADLRLSLVRQSNGDSALMILVDEIGGPIDGIHDPLPGSAVGNGFTVFLAQESGFGHDPAEDILKVLLDGYVVFGDIIGAAEFGMDILVGTFGLQHDGSGLSGGFNNGF